MSMRRFFESLCDGDCGARGSTGRECASGVSGCWGSLGVTYHASELVFLGIGDDGVVEPVVGGVGLGIRQIDLEAGVRYLGERRNFR